MLNETVDLPVDSNNIFHQTGHQMAEGDHSPGARLQIEKNNRQLQRFKFNYRGVLMTNMF